MSNQTGSSRDLALGLFHQSVVWILSQVEERRDNKLLQHTHTHLVHMSILILLYVSIHILSGLAMKPSARKKV